MRVNNVDDKYRYQQLYIGYGNALSLSLCLTVLGITILKSILLGKLYGVKFWYNQKALRKRCGFSWKLGRY